jgi:hypothetical protein
VITGDVFELVRVRDDDPVSQVLVRGHPASV